MTKEMYDKCRNEQMVAWVKLGEDVRLVFGGYARGNNKDGTPRNYCDESRRNLLAQANKIRDVHIRNDSYLDLHIPANSLIYCDPPYAGTTQYKDKFDHVIFWDWVRAKVADGHTCFVSEYTAPDDFTCVWAKTVNNTLVSQTGSKQGVEKLFKMKETKDG